MRVMALCGLVVVHSAFWGASSGFGQTRTEFEVASIRPTHIDIAEAKRAIESGMTIRVGRRIRGTRVEYIGVSLARLICEAYDLNPFQVIGPGWLASARFDIIAERPAASRDQDISLMLQTLLADRFKLTVHREVKDQHVYALIIAKEGAKLKETPVAPPAPDDSRQEGSDPVERSQQSRDVTLAMRQDDTVIRSTIRDAAKRDAVVHVEAKGMTMPALAEYLTRRLAGDGRLVVDETGLAGRYEVSLDIPISQFGTVMTIRSDASEAGPTEAASEPGGRSLLLRSLRNLGLDLVPRKAPVAKLVIDHIERSPTPN